MNRIANVVARWYSGEYIPPKNEPGAMLHFTMGTYRYHWSARMVRAIAYFYLSHWKWLWPFLVGVAGLIVALNKR